MDYDCRTKVKSLTLARSYLAVKCASENVHRVQIAIRIYKLHRSASKWDLVDKDYSSRWAALLRNLH